MNPIWRWSLATLTLCTAVIAEQPNLQNNGIHLTTGLGLSPIYIEEIVTAEELTFGASVTPIHASAVVHFKFGNLAATLSNQYNLYTDNIGHNYFSGLTAIGPTIYLPHKQQSYLSAAAGIARKQIPKAELSANGVGLLFSGGYYFSERVFAELGFSYLAFDQVTSLVSRGEQETISSTYLTLSYQLF